MVGLGSDKVVLVTGEKEVSPRDCELWVACEGKQAVCEDLIVAVWSLEFMQVLAYAWNGIHCIFKHYTKSYI